MGRMFQSNMITKVPEFDVQNEVSDIIVMKIYKKETCWASLDSREKPRSLSSNCFLNNAAVQNAIQK